jgi:hypothetical protein
MEGVQLNVPMGLVEAFVLKDAFVIAEFHDIKTESAGFASEELTVNENGIPGHAVAENCPVPFIPLATGKIFGLQFIVINCISLMTLPIKTPFLYSLTKIAVAPISLSAVGVMVISPFKEFIVVAGDAVNGEVNENPGLNITFPVAVVAVLYVLGEINEYTNESPFKSITP